MKTKSDKGSVITAYGSQARERRDDHKEVLARRLKPTGNWARGKRPRGHPRHGRYPRQHAPSAAAQPDRRYRLPADVPTAAVRAVRVGLAAKPPARSAAPSPSPHSSESPSTDAAACAHHRTRKALQRRVLIPAEPPLQLVTHPGPADPVPGTASASSAAGRRQAARPDGDLPQLARDLVDDLEERRRLILTSRTFAPTRRTYDNLPPSSAPAGSASASSRPRRCSSRPGQSATIGTARCAGAPYRPHDLEAPAPPRSPAHRRDGPDAVLAGRAGGPGRRGCRIRSRPSAATGPAGRRGTAGRGRRRRCREPTRARQVQDRCPGSGG